LYLLLDECCPKSLIGIADGLGHTAQRTLAIAELGRQATDAAIFAFACEARAIVVLALAARVPDHPGLVLLPSLPPGETGQLFRKVLRAADEALRKPGGVIRINRAGRRHRSGAS
jgi:predicted nuclease of predicted toxin-antitoxin system